MIEIRRHLAIAGPSTPRHRFRAVRKETTRRLAPCPSPTRRPETRTLCDLATLPRSPLAHSPAECPSQARSRVGTYRLCRWAAGKALRGIDPVLRRLARDQWVRLHVTSRVASWSA